MVELKHFWNVDNIQNDMNFNMLLLYFAFGTSSNVSLFVFPAGAKNSLGSLD